MRHEWVVTKIQSDLHTEIICIACNEIAVFLSGERVEENIPGDPRHRNDCRGIEWYNQNRKLSRERQQRLRAEGLCQSCGVRPRVNETRCEECRDNLAEDARLRRSANK